jgi:hypothetical protein
MKQHSLMWLVSVALASNALGSSIASLSAVGASIPYPYNAGPSDPISLASITDGSTDTFVTLNGLDNILQDNGFRVDTGTFYLFHYLIPLSAPAFHIDFTAAVQYPGGAEEFLIEAVNQDGSTRNVQWELDVSEPRTFSITFYQDSNDGNQGDLGRAWGLDDIQQPDGSLVIVLQASYFAQFDRSGFVSSTLYEVSAQVIPEPTEFGMFLLGVFSLGIFSLKVCSGAQGAGKWKRCG